MIKLLIILGSTRQNRQGDKVARWLCDITSRMEGLEAELIDLAQWPLPFFDEPMPPDRLNGHYSSEIAQRWSVKVRGADAFLIVTPEYNHGYPAVLKNALDYLYHEWGEKPVAFVGYSGRQSGAIRAIEQLRQVVVELQMVPIRESVCIPAMWQTFNGNGCPKDETITARAERMIEQLLNWARNLKTIRFDKANKPEPQNVKSA